MKNLFSLLFILTSALAFTSNAQDKLPYIETSVEVSQEVIPDVIMVDIYLSEAQSKGKISIEELDSALARALKSCSVDIDKSVSLTSQSSTDVKKNNGYRYKNYRVRLSNAENVDALFSALAENQINKAFVSETSYSLKEQLLDSLCTVAVKKAKEKASSMSQAIGQSIGSSIYIKNSSHYAIDGNRLFATKASMSDNMEGGLSDMSEAQMQKITYSEMVTMRFVLNPLSDK